MNSDSRPSEVLTIGAGRATAHIDPVAGGRVAQIVVGDQSLLIEPDSSRTPTIGWGSFPMAPWVGRIRHGRFTYDGRDHGLECNHLDGPEGPGDRARRHAIHGTVFARNWHVDSVTSTAIEMHCPLVEGTKSPFAGGMARQRIEISEHDLECRLSIEAGGAPFPALLGWHPWFIVPARLSFLPTKMYERDPLGLPTGELVEPAPAPWDDCFLADGPVVAEYERDEARTVTVASDCNHWVIFDGHAGALCIEPQTGPPDGFNVESRDTGPGSPGHEGMAYDLVEPGRPLVGTMTISW